MNEVALKIETLRKEVSQFKRAIRQHQYIVKIKVRQIEKYERELKSIGITLEITGNK